MSCKHMYLRSSKYIFLRVNRYMVPEQTPETMEDISQGEPEEQDIVDFPPIPAPFPPQVKEVINAERIKKQLELKRKRQEERVQSFADCEHELVSLVRELVKHVQNPKRVCTVEYYQAL
ncbi:hypothetical protein BGZ98_005454 [Dissophora globulifera]|nr:hypothetical protein BGZ98_005454 [Dissophora globulifera]